MSDNTYTVANHSEYKEVYAAGLSNGNQLAGIASQAKSAFKLMSRILKKESLNFSDVVRQWNYIENILGVTSDKDGLKQNYQLFNDVRSMYYQTANFKNGYPAATGIGMIAGGVILDFIAVNASNPISVVPIKNPRQIDAHRYSQDVLVGDSITGNSPKTCPKFERAKTLTNSHSGQIFISGTAAILGQNTINEHEVTQQTITTIQNIEKLISMNNLKSCGVQINSDIESLSYARVYVKYEADIPKVKRICERYFVDVPALYLVSDICRDDLLVEIEGVTEFR